MSLPDELRHDLRGAARAFRREPAFVAGVVLTFALAIGATAAMFGMVERLMLAPPPGIHGADRVVRVALEFRGDGGESYQMSTLSYPAFRTIESLGPAFTDVTAVRTDTMTMGRGAELSELAAVQATGRYFGVLGVHPALGRFFGPADDAPPAGNDVVVLGYAFWQRHFSGDGGVIGSQLLINERQLTIIGVAPRGFNGTELAPIDVFVPLHTAFRDQDAGWWSNPGMRVVSVVARLRDGITATTAGTLTASALRESASGATSEPPASVTLESLVPGRSARTSPQAQIALWLSGVSLVVLLIATANVGTLLLLRAARRRRELATRITLGATKGQLVRRALVESLVLALVGAAVGLVLSQWFGGILRATLLPNLAPGDRVVDQKLLIATILAASGAGLLAGLSSLARSRQRDLAADLRAGGGPGSSGRSGFSMRWSLRKWRSVWYSSSAPDYSCAACSGCSRRTWASPRPGCYT